MFSWIIEKLFTLISVIAVYLFNGVVLIVGLYIAFFMAIGMIIGAPFYYVSRLVFSRKI
jgi:hypothetical protein